MAITNIDIGYSDGVVNNFQLAINMVLLWSFESIANNANGNEYFEGELRRSTMFVARTGIVQMAPQEPPVSNKIFPNYRILPKFIY